ncbi:alpha-mannosidase [Saccharibacillus alkalitolerans]|uniref:Alpha-mannosidase n=1 Tax=Saccharibacillus alkalitolerans TaxID=2705290 RepID=A0ABX0F365_9BACL|nr:alpha-mannosidase [Saccharibacillus alkalitolerans]NGZ74454.1 alpha-mannosidase [Saccharibacillus alkalitolerans]
MFQTEEKLAARIAELEPYRYRDAVRLDEWLGLEDEAGENGAYPPAFADLTGEEAEAAKTYRIGDSWTGRDRYLWLYRQAEVPSGWAGRNIVGRFDFGRTGDFYNSGFEALLFVDGRPYQGVDSNHQEVFLAEGTAGGTLELAFRLWSGLEGGGRPLPQEHRLRLAELAWLDPDADDLYYTARAVLGVFDQLPASEALKPELLALLNGTFRLLDWSKPGSEAFYASVREARVRLRERLSGMRREHPVTVTAVGHTHIDVAWLWRLTHTREKAARSFSTVLRLMEQFPEYVFLQTQPQLYEYIRRDYPELYERIAERVQEGRWEAGGAMWLEADCNLPSGESLVRQILHGTRFFREAFGTECTHLWLPDVFGYSWALPQILRKSGIETFMTTKIGWNKYNRMPHDTFYWKGIDGSEVLTHFITTPARANSPGYTYNGVIEAFSVQGIWDGYRDKRLNRELLLAYGYGDGGGGVTRDMLEMRRRLDDLPGVPNVKPGRADDYFKRLSETIRNADEYVHKWDGELYLETHRGTYTSQAHTKRMNRKLELLYREAEWLQVLSAAEKGDFGAYPADELREGWKILLRNQFHDIIPGSAIREVYEDAGLEYEQAEKIGRTIAEQAASELVGLLGGGQAADGATPAGSEERTSRETEESFSVFNGAFFGGSRLVEAESADGEAKDWRDAQGRSLIAQRIGARSWLVETADLPMLGSASLRAYPADSGQSLPKTPNEPFAWDGTRLTTPFYELEWNGCGQLSRIYDREAEREVLAEGECGSRLQVFEDKPLEYDAWNIDLYYGEKMREITELTSMELTADGPLFAALRLTWRYMDSAVVQDVRVYAGSRRIDFETAVDWHERHQLLKVAFPVAVRAVEATYDIQFGNVKRPTHWNTSWDYARFETVGHQWADLSERGYGVSLLNDCKYGYDIKENVMRLTLIKSATDPDWDADQGEHRFTYSLLPHVGDWAEGRTAEEAWMLNNPLRAVPGLHAGGEGRSLIRTDSDALAVDAVKGAEDGDGFIVRLHEYTGRRVRARLASDYGVRSWQLCDLMERPLEEEREDAFADCDFKPYEILTLRVRLADRKQTR